MTKFSIFGQNLAKIVPHKKTLSSHPADAREIEIDLFVNLQRFLLTAKNIEKSGNLKPLISAGEHALQLFENFDKIDQKRADLVKILNKIRYNLADFYTKDFMTDFEKAENMILQFYKMENDDNFSKFIEPEVKESFRKMEINISVCY